MSIATHLGQTSQYTSSYDPSLLVTELRESNRIGQDITSEMLGRDLWNVYEISFLTTKGYPVNGIGKITYPSTNKTIVESKSLKLYFFSWNMTRIGTDASEAIDLFSAQVTKDLSELLDTQVDFLFFPVVVEPPCHEPFTGYDHIDVFPGVYNLEFVDVNENPKLLEVTDNPSTFNVHSSLLRSNCKITNQPDYGDVFIHYNGPKTLSIASLVRYLVSFRSENHFHEEVCEMIYDRLVKALEPEELVVACRYTRRGGIDINPIRANKEELIPNVYTPSNVVLKKLPRQ